MPNTIASATSSREAFILAHLGQVHLIARQLQRRLPAHITFDDLVSVGTVGLITAVDRFDQSRGLQLKTYAEHRIRGAMLDLLRKEDTRSRAERCRLRNQTNADQSASGRVLSLDRLLEKLPQTMLMDQRPSPCAVACEAERQSALAAARQRLPAIESRVLFLKHDEGWTNRAIAAELGMHESRVSQIATGAVRKLRCLLADHRERAA